MSFDTIDLLSGKVFQVTWDLGRRCNYDCSYCPAHRHDNFSKHASLEELKQNVNFLLEYIDLYMDTRITKEASIGFTGGEPTVNPNFIEFIKYLKAQYTEKYSNKWHASFALTSNGAMSEKIADAIMDNMDHITVSYHTEANDALKKRALDRVKQFHKNKNNRQFTMSLNVMFHAQYFDECIELCEELESLSIPFVPRVIGEEPDSRSSFAHQYTEEQLKWMKIYWKSNTNKLQKKSSILIKDIKKVVKDQSNNSNTPENKKLGMTIGRPCCGSREMMLINKDESKVSKFSDLREFKGWYCSVNYFFLHLEQQTDSVFHHQTCQARFDSSRGPIGKISEGTLLLKELKENINSNKMPNIVCTKQTCGCGLCSPKSSNIESYLNVLKNHIINI